MVQICVVKFCSNSDKTGHSIHRFPKDKTLRHQWTRFVQVKRADFSDRSVTENTVICGAHFTRDSFSNSVKYDLGFSERRELCEGAVPTIQPHISEEDLAKERAKKRRSLPESMTNASRSDMYLDEDLVKKPRSNYTSRLMHKKEVARVSFNFNTTVWRYGIRSIRSQGRPAPSFCRTTRSHYKLRKAWAV